MTVLTALRLCPGKGHTDFSLNWSVSPGGETGTFGEIYLATQRSVTGKDFVRRRYRGPAKLREQPDRGLFDELVLGVGVGHGSKLSACSKEQLLKKLS